MARKQPASAAATEALPGPDDPGRGALAVFDLDRTLVPGSSLVALGRQLVRSGLLPAHRLVGAAVQDAAYRRRGSTDAQVGRLRARTLAAVAGIEREPVLAVVADVADALVLAMSPGARMLVDLQLIAGSFCVVLSASPQELVDAVGARLGAHRSVGTRAEVVDGRFTGRLDGPLCYGPGKLERLAAAVGPVDLSAAWAYADSASDLPLLEATGHPVAVNPDRRLRVHANRAGWPVLRVA